MWIWSKSGAFKRSHLYIFMDSCHSEGWCRQLSQMGKNHKNISIFASCGQDQFSQDFKFGGLLFQCILQTSESQMEEYLKVLNS